jgi:anti-sigma factor RsiW
MDHSINEHELHLYVDGHLDEARRAAVEAYLEQHPEAAARVRDYVQQNEMMRQLFGAAGAVPRTEAQERLLRRLEQRLGRSRFHILWRPASAVAAALVMAAALGATVTELYNSDNTVEPRSSFADTAARVHSFYASAASEPTEFGADAAAKLNTQLDKRLGAPVRLPDLSQKGFSMVAGRLLPTSDGVAAQLLYRDKAGRLVTVFVGPANGGPRTAAMRPVQRQDLSLYTWLDGRVDVAVVGGLNGDELRGIAEAAQRSLRAADGPAAPDRPPPRSDHHDGGGGSRT